VWDTAGSGWIHWTHHWTQLHPSARLVVPLGKQILERGKKNAQQLRERERKKKKKSVRNNTADTKISEEGQKGGASGSKAEILLQPMEKTMVKQVVFLQSVENHARADVHTEAHGGPHDKAGGYALRKLQLVESPCRSRILQELLPAKRS